MKIFQEGIFAGNFHGQMSNKHSLLCFEGPVPANISELPFAENADQLELFNACLGATDLTSVREGIDSEVIKFIAGTSLKYFPGYQALDGKFDVAVSKVIASAGLYEGRKISGLIGEVNIGVFIGPRDSTGESLEFTTSIAIEASRIVLDKGSHGYSYYCNMDFEVWNGSTWIQLAQVTSPLEFNKNTPLVFDIAPSGITSDLYRVIFTGQSGSTTAFPKIKFFTDVEPATQITSTPTWGLIIPNLEMAVSKEGKFPLLWCPLGGPNGGKEIAVQKDSYIGQEKPVLMNFKMKANVLGAVL